MHLAQRNRKDKGTLEEYQWYEKTHPPKDEGRDPEGSGSGRFGGHHAANNREGGGAKLRPQKEGGGWRGFGR